MRLKTNTFSDGAIEVIKILEDAGYKADLVGGCVRDAILGRPAKDEDITTDLAPEKVIKLFKDAGYKVLPTGLQHGTVTVMVKTNEGLVGYEVTTYRIDGESSDQRHPDSVTFVDNIKLDMERRDLTINAMAFNPNRGLTDFFGGINDLQNKVIRTVGNPKDRFKEDALRMMRAIRFSAQLGFTIADEVKEAIKECHADIKNVSKERIHDELVKILLSPNPTMGIKELSDLGLLKEFAPLVDRIFDEKLAAQNNPWHLYTVGGHTLKVIENTPNDIVLRMAALCHDLGKIDKKTTDEKGIDHFYNHPVRSAEIAKDLMKELKFTSKEVEEVTMLVGMHDARINPSRKSVEKFILNHQNITPEFFMKLLLLQTADCLGQNISLSQTAIDDINAVREIYLEITKGPFRFCDLAINGMDIMSITETAKGEKISLKDKEIAEAKKEALRYVLSDPTRNTKEELMTFVKRHAKQIKSNAVMK